ncbi:RDD family protein [Pseudolysinimonas kribbensis]|uniref:RDD family protein n=1 Tax=Pseudolysinimonas kribbensis TaxID=433641 RepID=UPI0031DD2FA7
MSASSDRSWPGRGLGLPEDGPRSIARIGRRIGAIAIDWGISYALAWTVFHQRDLRVDGLYVLAVFAVLTILFELFFLGSPGHLILRMRVVPLRGGRLAPWQPLVRTLLLCLVIPAVIPDGDQRGLHDRAAATILVRV